MCGPATIPTTFALDAEVAERLDERGGGLLLAGGVGLRLVGGRALEEAAGRDLPDERRVVGDARAVAALRREVGRIDVADGDAGLVGLLQLQLLDIPCVVLAGGHLVGLRVRRQVGIERRLLDDDLGRLVAEQVGVALRAVERGCLDVRRAHDEPVGIGLRRRQPLGCQFVLVRRWACCSLRGR